MEVMQDYKTQYHTQLQTDTNTIQNKREEWASPHGLRAARCLRAGRRVPAGGAGGAEKQNSVTGGEGSEQSGFPSAPASGAPRVPRSRLLAVIFLPFRFLMLPLK